MTDAPAQQLALPPESHRNHYLFSDHYLDHVVPTLPAWRSADVAPLLAELAALWSGFTPQDENEAQTEEAWIRPVLRALGHAFNVQVSMRTPLGSKTPDYILYPDVKTATAAPRRDLAEADFRGALAVGDAKAWDRRLDQALSAQQRAAGPKVSENPSFQIDFYIRHSGLPWGILTNGRLWRLYHHETSHKLDVCYEVDLPALLTQATAPTASPGDVAAFRYFALFFRREAFLGAPCWLDAVLRESRSYARGISDTLKEQVYEALGLLSQGLLDFPDNALSPDEATLQEIHDNSLIVLYRLLFTLYAEDRGLLPVRENAAYRQTYSLFALKRQVARDLDQGRPAIAAVDDLWQRLRNLWRVIDAGNAELGVPAYNGGLFQAGSYPFLERHSVGDSHLRAAIDRLARVAGGKGEGRQFVDYRDLEVRHLGSIYEGLLEYRLRHATEDLAVTRQKGRDVYVPAAAVGLPVAVPTGRLYLATDKGERKATGSYYTPDYIVQHIVEHAVGPVLEEARAAHADDAAALAETVLTVNVLDPAMGSGHFLVAAADHIARFLVSLGLPMPADLGDEGELPYWRRRVAQNCIYGVDLNPLAVELAKLSLWLATVARDRPLSFLDHHLRCGNSLVAARVADLPLTGGPAPKAGRRRARREVEAEAAGQLSMLEDSAFAGAMSTANFLMAEIESIQGETLDDVHRAEALYRDQVRAQTAKARRLADVWTARHFGLELDAALWPGLVQHVLHGAFALPQHRALLADAARIAAEHHFFHWELEFPEVFFDRFGRLAPETGGFDAVVGNPPYVRQEVLKPFKPFFASTFTAMHNVADLYLYFYEQGLHLLAPGRRMSYISSGTFARANFAAPFRQFLPTVAQIESLIDYGENQPFAGAEMVRPTITVIQKAPQSKPFRALFIADKVPESLDAALDADGVECDPRVLAKPEWVFQPAAASRLFDKLLAHGRPLVEVVDGRIYYGIKTGLNEAFIIDTPTRDRLVAEDPRSAEIIRPVLRGEDLRPWYDEDEGRWLIVVPAGWTRQQVGQLAEEAAWHGFLLRYAAVAEHLIPFADAARVRADKGDYWWELRPCDYYAAFDEPKVFWPDIAKLPRFSHDESGMYINNKGYIAPGADAFVLGLLQSRTLWYSVKQLCQPLRLRGGLWQYQLFTQFISRLPIPDAPAPGRAAIGDLAMAITGEARARYALHRRVRARVVADLGVAGVRLNQRLTAWWGLDFPAFRAQVKKVFRHDIPVRERDEWDAWLVEARAEHERRTAEIVRLETDLNARVYTLFDLTPAEIRLVEESTKYRYGEV